MSYSHFAKILCSGTRTFSVELSTNFEIWTTEVTGMLPDVRNVACANIPLEEFFIANGQGKPARFVRLNAIDSHDIAVGFNYVEFVI